MTDPIPLDEPTFRLRWPAFESTEDYPSESVKFWLGIAPDMVNQRRWGTQWNLGIALFVAHQLTLEKQAADEAAAGNPAGSATGPLSSESVGPISKSYDVAASSPPNAGHWNLTTYGTRWVQLARGFGAGPLQF